MPGKLRDAAADVVGCDRCGSDFRPWRTGGVCPLCALPASVDPLREALGPRPLTALDFVQSAWRLSLVGLVWVLIIVTLIIVWTTDAGA